MGGAVGFGNLLRYPSQVFNNNGLQWFIPYLMAILLLAIPVLVLEVAIGQAYRGYVQICRVVDLCWLIDYSFVIAEASWPTTVSTSAAAESGLPCYTLPCLWRYTMSQCWPGCFDTFNCESVVLCAVLSRYADDPTVLFKARCPGPAVWKNFTAAQLLRMSDLWEVTTCRVGHHTQASLSFPKQRHGRSSPGSPSGFVLPKVWQLLER
jgi:hypothetical protein